jgi:hypothetical protein
VKGNEIVEVSITWERREMLAEFSKKERDNFESLDIDRISILSGS